jgi:hypothetical protein
MHVEDKTLAKTDLLKRWKDDGIRWYNVLIVTLRNI